MLELQLAQAQSATNAASAAVYTPPLGQRPSFSDEPLDGRPRSGQRPSSPVEGLLPFPKTVILDSEAFSPLPRNGAYELMGRTPSSVLEAIGHEWNNVCDRYFSGPHQWMPFLSQKRLAQNLARAPLEFNTGVAMLLLCMKLLSEPLQSDELPEKLRYQMTKQYLASVESSGSLSLLLVQSMILIALYELGHAIHPAAYLRVGRAARLGYLLGLHDRDHATQMFKAPDTWTLCEEERRTWWAIIVLDR